MVWWVSWRGRHNNTGFNSGRKRKKQAEAPGPEVVSKKQVDTHERVQTLVDKLKNKHANNFSPMQYRIWGELIVGGQHVSMDEAPANNSMFTWAGGGAKTKSKNASVQSRALTEAATVLSSASTHWTCSRLKKSPAKLIENRSNFCKQLSEL